MTHQEYKEAIEHQQSLINRLFTWREERSKKIQQLTEERYANLIGKFFKANEELFRADSGKYYFIVGVTTESNYVSSNKVVIRLHCRTYGTTQCSTDNGWRITGVDYVDSTFRFEVNDDIVALLEPMFVSRDEVISDLTDLQNRITSNFLSIS